LGIITRRARKVVICGGGRSSVYLADLLEKEGVSVCLIERDENRCRVLAETLHKTQIIHADATDQQLLESERLYDCDAMVSMTGIDEMNMIISLYGNVRKIPQIITKLSHPGNRSVIDTLKLGSVVSTRELSSNDIVRYVRAMKNQTGAAISLHSIADDQAEAVEFVVDEHTKNCGVPLKNLKLKPGVLIGTITRGRLTEIPGGDSVFHPGNSLVVITNGRGTLQQLNDIFD
jgi:trk system potassium uptake protein TrkA